MPKYKLQNNLHETDMTCRVVSCDHIDLQPRRVRRQARRIPERLVREMLDQAVIRVFVVPSDGLWSETRGPTKVAFARQVAMYLAHVTCGLSFTEAGHLFARDR